jgi:hypothetical protein
VVSVRDVVRRVRDVVGRVMCRCTCPRRAAENDGKCHGEGYKSFLHKFSFVRLIV